MYAIIETGGKQYKVSEGDKIKVEKLESEVDSQVALASVIAVMDGENLKAGTPYVDGAVVKAKVLSHGKGKKLTVVHYKAKKNIHTKNGHRQPYTELLIENIAL